MDLSSWGYDKRPIYVASCHRTVKRAKDRLRQITRRNRGIALDKMVAAVNSFTTGWVTYYRHAQCKRTLAALDGTRKREHLGALKQMGVDLTAYLTRGRPDRVIELRGSDTTTHLHMQTET